MSVYTKGAVEIPLEFEKEEDETTGEKKSISPLLLHSSYMAKELRTAETCVHAS